MCAPLAMAGLQVASSLAQGAAEASSLRRQARAAEQDAKAAAATHAARAEFARDRAGRDSAADRARVSMSSVDPASESIVASLSAAHAARLDPARLEEDAARGALAEGARRSAEFRRASRTAVYRSLIGSAATMVNRAVGGNVIAIPE